MSLNDLEKVMPYLYFIAFHRHVKIEDKELTFISYLWSAQNFFFLSNVIELLLNFALSFEGNSIKTFKFWTKIMSLAFMI